MATIITFQPTVQIINEQGVKTPCIARIYKDGQWRQCRVQYYQLQPLIAEPLITEPVDETIYGADGLPIHVAIKDILNDEYTQLLTSDGYLLMDTNNMELVIGG